MWTEERLKNIFLHKKNLIKNIIKEYEINNV